MADRLRALVRRGDTVARLGGDEFAIVQRDLQEPDDARHLAERVLREIKSPFLLAGNLVYVGASIGIVLGPEDGDTRDEFMRKADIALYQAKGSGKGRHCIFAPELDDIVRQKRAIERDLREALEKGLDLRVIYQPLFCADGVTLAGAEALLRWDHPAHGMLSPAVFVAVAEERGLMPRLGNWVLREACRTAKELNLPWIAVNVSAVQFREADFVDSVLDMLKETGLSPERLQLEITEGLLLDATDAVASAITKLRFAGVCIALDDFGTGYSSLQYLNRYKVDKIKIDRSFVQRLGLAADSDAIVRAMLDLARALHLDVTAEGVETREQWETLNALGAPEMQGFLFSQPIDRDALNELFAGRHPARRSA